MGERMTKEVEFNTQVNSDDLRNCSLFLATPMYDGACTAGYSKSLMNLGRICLEMGIPLKTYFITNESLVQRARNYCADMFMESGMSHMLFIDADIEFNADDVIRILGVHVANPKLYDVLAAPYPKKGIEWNKVKYFADKVENPAELAHVTGDFVFNTKDGNPNINMGIPTEVMETGTGFMLIPRYVFERFKNRFPKYRYRPDHKNTTDFDGSREIMAYFHCEIDKKTKRYLSEDYFFCQKIREIGLKVHLVPWIELTHIGRYAFDGSLVKEFQMIQKLQETK